MFILGIDTSSDWLNIALGEDGHLVNSRSLYIPKQHIGILHIAINEILKESDRDISDIDLFVIVRGPGSFTGIRIAVTAAKGFTYALNKKCISLISLDLIAHNVKNKKQDFIQPIIDARRNQVYTALYEKEEDNLICISDYQLLKIEQVLEKIDSQTLLVGDGISAYSELINEYKKKKQIHIVQNKKDWIISPQNIIEMGYKKFQKEGEENIFDLKPFYIYPKECTIRNIQMKPGKR